ncbi:hypothetical protein GLAREA_10131 [Glarea lozoyensis ATCC 20868]|uniref:Uncharacterized protein n=1 Tax=Glarea lozoyensis (strain ATCC 20868 / MF5171) TaxID=1116229 RepID=S3D7G5_GLAL2|nr:uncharacterized protein GLAREA_10131 [Glarea lozoyensis ATCC 20868]EPE34437.1 hypothetical protein GLAREA_10131 [Glarea lozoyensis ATCC 20868]
MARQRPSWVNKTLLTSQVYDVIEGFVSSPNCEASEIATSLTSLFLPFTRTRSDIENVDCLWGTIFWTASTFFPGATEHWRLIELVREIQRIPAPPGEAISADEDANGHEWWVDLPGWTRVWADLECDAPITTPIRNRKGATQEQPMKFTPGPWRREDGKPMSALAWTNLNAFAAKLYAQTPLDYLGLIGLQSFLEALEKDISPRDLDNVVPAAACWVLSAGKSLWDNSEEFGMAINERDPIDSLTMSGGELYTGTRGLSDERWTFWKERFAILSKRLDLSPNTRLFASQAFDEMKCIEVRK